MEALQRNLNHRMQSLVAVVAGWDEEASDDLPPSVPCLGAPNEVENCLFLHYIGESMSSIIRIYVLLILD